MSAVAGSGRLPVGFWLMTANLHACEISKEVGYDIVVLDLEHGTWNPESVDRAIALGKAVGLTVYARVGGAERVPIQSALDAGADAVVVPQIRNAEHARAAASYAKYPPVGTRGIGHSRINRYGGFSPEFLDAENRRTQCIVMIETQEAFDQRPDGGQHEAGRNQHGKEQGRRQPGLQSPGHHRDPEVSPQRVEGTAGQIDDLLHAEDELQARGHQEQGGRVEHAAQQDVEALRDQRW